MAFDPDAYLAEKQGMGGAGSFNPDAYLAQKNADNSSPDMARNVTREVGQGATFGFSDEVASAAAATAAKIAQTAGVIPGSKDWHSIYKDILDHERSGQADFEKQHPHIAMGAQLAGAALPTILTAGAAAPTEAASLGNLALRGTAMGAVQGGLYGAGTATEGNRLEGAKSGAELGAVAGGLLDPTAVLGGRVLSSGAQAVGGLFTGPETKAANIIKEVANRSGITGEAAAQKIQQLGPEATLADVDENLLAQAKAAIDQFGPTKQAARQMVSDRQLGEHGDVLKTLSKQLGGFSGDDMYDALAKNLAARQSRASPLYKVALDTPLPNTKEVQLLQNIPAVQDALKTAETYAARDPSRIFDVEGNYASKPLSETERFHYAKQALFDAESAAKRSGENQKAMQLGQLRTKVTDALDSIPEYKLARQIWSSSMENENAADVGKRFFKMNPKEFDNAIKGMNDADKQMAKMGVMSAAAEKAGAAADSRSVSGMLTSKLNDRQKIQSLFGGNDPLDALLDNAKKWDTFRHTANRLTGGSPTSENLAAAQEMGGIEAIKDPIGALKKEAANAIFSSKMSPQVAKHIGEILTKQGLSEKEVMNLIGKENSSFLLPRATVSGAAPALSISQRQSQ